MAHEMPLITMTKTDLRKNAQKIVMVAQLFASFTPTLKDDQTVAIFNSLINNEEQFDGLCELLGITDNPTI